jgi:predicted transcriptional regulator
MPGKVQRPDLYLVARLLENLEREGGRCKPTVLQLVSGINYTQLERYVQFLAGRGLVASVSLGEGSVELEITARGREMLLFLARAIRDVLQEEFGRGRSTEVPRRSES